MKASNSIYGFFSFKDHITKFGTKQKEVYNKGGSRMKNTYVLYTEDGALEGFWTRDQAIKKVKEYYKQGVNAYVVSELEAKNIEESNENFHIPKWE